MAVESHPLSVSEIDMESCLEEIGGPEIFAVGMDKLELELIVGVQIPVQRYSAVVRYTAHEKGVSQVQV